MGKKIKIKAFDLLEKIRREQPLVHHLTNWVTIYDCANIVKALGGSPVMAHAAEEVAQMASIASALVLNIGTLTSEFVEAMKVASFAANKKKIPVILDVCGAGATRFREEKSFELLKSVRIDIIKGNSSEISRIAGEEVMTKGVDAVALDKDTKAISQKLSRKYNCTVVMTGRHDIVADKNYTYIVKNGHPMMSCVVGTGCMAASCIGAFAAVEKDLGLASASALVCFEIAAELAARTSRGPGSFKEKLFDSLYSLDKQTVNRMQKVEIE